MKAKYYPILDSLRGISILWVIIHHIPVGYPKWLEFIRERGDLGVELFFAISGILVTKSLISTFKRDQSKTQSIKEYFIKRASRIFPPFYLTLAILFGLSFFVGSLGAKLNSISDIIFSFPTYTYNYAKYFTTGEIPGAFGIFWSLCFEEQFYILLLLIFISVPRKYLNKTLLVIIAGSVAMRIFGAITPVENYYGKLQHYTHLRLDAILLGSLAMFNYEKTSNFFSKYSFLTLASVGVLIFATINHNFTSELNRSINFFFVSLGFTLLSLSALFGNTKDKLLTLLRKLVENRVLISTGVISYEIYLVHQLFNGILAKSPIKSNVWLYTVCLIGLSYAGAYLMHRYFSSPMNMFIRKKLLKQRYSQIGNSNVLVAEE